MLWPAIFMVTALNTHTDIFVIHRKYTLTPRQKLEMFVHHIIILTVLLGIFFTDRKSILVHALVVAGCLVCWFMNDGCIMAQWQRSNVGYTPDDLVAIHGTPEKQLEQFIGTIGPVALITVYKLRALL